MFFYVLIVIIIVSLGVIAYIFLKKVPKAVAVNSKATPMVKQLQVKRKILEERLDRRFKGTLDKSLLFLKPLGRLIIKIGISA